MRNIGCLFLLTCFWLHTARAQQPFKIRGVLPWHNFLSGPSAWNESDYKKYLAECAAQGINFIGFHNYTGGGERYAPYVEPMIRISYKQVLPEAGFDHSMTARWGYTPMKVKDFAFGTAAAFRLPAGAEAFGADAAVLARSKEAHYRNAQALMQKVVRMAKGHQMQVAMGFEFGVLPPEYYSLNDGSRPFYWPGEANMVPNPAHPLTISLLHRTIDDILEKYPDIDWVWLWLNEHSFMGVDTDRALQDTAFKRIYDESAPLFSEAKDNSKARFIGVWSLHFIRLAQAYLQTKAPRVKIMIGGWGGGNQLPLVLKGLDRQLPPDIVFSCLNPDLGRQPQPAFLAEIAKHRKVIAVPWLEGDHQLWHYQPRVNFMRDHVRMAAEQKLNGVIAIHWRTKEVALNFETFARFARQPGDTASVEQLYAGFLEKHCGKKAAGALTGLFVEMDKTQNREGISSPEYFAYSPRWGQMNAAVREQTRHFITAVEQVLQEEKAPVFRKNLNWFRDTFLFELLLDEVSRGLEPAFHLRNAWLASGGAKPGAEQLSAAKQAFEKAPVERLYKTFAGKVSSRGELGELSSLNQKLWSEYLELKKFLQRF